MTWKDLGRSVNMKRISFNSKDIKAIFDGNKTNIKIAIDNDIINSCKANLNSIDLCKYKTGDVLYVKEEWAYIEDCEGWYSAAGFLHKEDPLRKYTPVKWRSATSMPKEAARIFLKITNVKIEKQEWVIEFEPTFI